MEAKAIAKEIRISPRKMRLSIDLIRGKDVTEADTILANLNNLITTTMLMSSNPQYVDVYNTDENRIDARWAVAPWIVRRYKNNTNQWLGPNSMKYDYKLKWRLS